MIDFAVIVGRISTFRLPEHPFLVVYNCSDVYLLFQIYVELSTCYGNGCYTGLETFVKSNAAVFQSVGVSLYVSAAIFFVILSFFYLQQ
jgi:hypothetical protein